MFRWCSYCQSYIGQKEPLGDYSLTHGICLKCKTNHNENFSEIGFMSIMSLFEQIRSSVSNGKRLEILPTLATAKKLKIKPADLLVGMIQPLLYEIGERYAKGDLHIYEEHQFSEFVTILIYELKKEYNLDIFDDQAPEALLFMADGESHQFGTKFLEVFLRQEGISATAICPGMPTAEILKMSEKYKPKVICISVTIKEHFEDLVESLKSFHDWSGPAPRIFIGGSGAEARPLPIEFAQVYVGPHTAFLELIISAINEKKAA